MSDKVFCILMAALIVLGIACSVALVAYTVYAYQHSSIIYYIASERW